LGTAFDKEASQTRDIAWLTQILRPQKRLPQDDIAFLFHSFTLR